MSEKIAIVTDSTCDLTSDALKGKDIHVIPLKVVYADRVYHDRIDIAPQEVYDRLEEEIPTTSVPSPHEFKEKLLELKGKKYTHVIAIHISTGLSGTCNAMRLMSKEVEGLTIEVIDSKALSMGLGRLALYAHDLLKKGLKFDEIVQKTREKVNDIKVFFVVATLKYLTKGGRIGKVEGTIGGLLKIKPIISINEDGVYYTYDKTRGRKKSLERLSQIVMEKIKEGRYIVDVMHAAAKDEAKALYEEFSKNKNVEEMSFGEIGPVLGVHVGPGLVGVTIMKI